MTLVETLAAIGAVMGPLSVMYGMHVNRLRDRDKQEAEQRARETDLKNAELAAKVTRCEADCSSARQQVIDSTEKRERAEVKAARLEGELAGTVRENKELRDENRDLRDRLKGKEDT
jgi:hypothetical protein